MTTDVVTREVSPQKIIGISFNVVFIPGAKEAIKRLRKCHDVIIVVPATEGQKDMITVFFDRYFSGVPYRIQLTGGSSKVDICKFLGISVFVENSPQEARSLSYAGISVFLCSTEDQDVAENVWNIRKMTSLDEVVKNILLEKY